MEMVVGLLLGIGLSVDKNITINDTSKNELLVASIKA